MGVIEKMARDMAADAGYDWNHMFDRPSVKVETLAVRGWWIDRAEAALAAAQTYSEGVSKQGG